MNRTGWIIGIVAVVAIMALIIYFKPFGSNVDPDLLKKYEAYQEKERVADSVAAAKAKFTEDSLANAEYQAGLIQAIVDSIKSQCCPDKKQTNIRQRSTSYIPPVEKKQETDLPKKDVTKEVTRQETKTYPEIVSNVNVVSDVKEFYDFVGLYSGDLGWHFPQLWMDAGWSDFSTGEVVPNPQRNGHNFRIKGEDLTDGFTRREGRTKDGTYYISASLVENNSPCGSCEIFLRCSENSWTPQKMSKKDGYYYLKP